MNLMIGVLIFWWEIGCNIKERLITYNFCLIHPNPLLPSLTLSYPLLPSLTISYHLLPSLTLSYPLLPSLTISYPLLNKERVPQAGEV